MKYFNTVNCVYLVRFWLVMCLASIGIVPTMASTPPVTLTPAPAPAATTTHAIAPARLYRTIASAAQHNDLPAVKKLIALGYSINSPLADGTTALHWATFNNETPLSTLLINEGAAVNVKNRYGLSPISLAAQNGNHQLVTLLLKKGADANTAQPSGETVLMTAARTGVAAVVQVLLEHGAQANAKDINAQTAIMWAASEGHLAVVNLLIAAKADFKTQLNSGFSPLFFAVREGRHEVALQLIKAGADINSVITAKKVGNKAAHQGSSPLIIAIENGHYELAIALIKAGADPNDQRSGFAPLHTLTWVRKPDRGDDVGDPIPEGSGTLTDLQFAEALIKHGADVNLQLAKGWPAKKGLVTWQGATAFLMACKRGDIPLVKLLLKHGADHALNNANGTTALMLASGLSTAAVGEEAGDENEALELVKMLIGMGQNVNVVNNRNETAMHGAAYKNFPSVVQLLADNGAQVDKWNIKNFGGWTPLLIAQGYRPGNYKPSKVTTEAIVKVMLAQGVQPPPPPKPGQPWDDTGY